MELFHFDIETVGSYKDYNDLLLNDKRGADLFLKKFNKMNWVEKYDDIDSAYINNAGIISTFGKIICISSGYINNNGSVSIGSYFGDNEVDIINDFNNLLIKVEKKSFNLSGFRIINFDIPWFLHKCFKYKIKPADIVVTHNKKPWEMRITDISEDWKGRFAWSPSFDEVAYELDIDSSKSIMSGSDVHTKYWSGYLNEIKDYCEQDVRASIEISKLIY